MAILTSDQLAEVRSALGRRNGVVNYNKAQINVATQAVEDWFEANRTSLNNAINAATSPFTFTAAQKKLIVAYWLEQKSGREKV